MAQFRKKPVVIEAVQWSGNSIGNPVPNWISDALQKAPHMVGGIIRVGEEVHIFTLEGTMIASPGDWIIRGVKGELYPCKPDIFEATYEAPDTPAAGPLWCCHVRGPDEVHAAPDYETA